MLSRIIPDEEQALSSATGIKLLVDLLQDSQSEPILALAADCIARLAHTRAGRYMIHNLNQYLPWLLTASQDWHILVQVGI